MNIDHSKLSGTKIILGSHCKKAFCFYCRLYYEQKELCLSKNIEPAFIRDGFNNWKKALQK